MAVTAPYALAKRDQMYRVILDALADGVTMERQALYRVLPMVHASTANRVIREMLASGQIVARRSLPGQSQPLRYAATMTALDLAVPPVRPILTRVRLHDGGRYRIMSAPCDRHSQGRVLVAMTWREELGVFSSSRGGAMHWPLAKVDAVYSSVARTFVPVSQCDRVPLTRVEKYVPLSTVGQSVVALLTAHGPLNVAEIVELLPHIRKTVLKTQIRRMEADQALMRHGVRMHAGREGTAWTLGPVTLEARPSRGRAAEPDTWVPGVWINPIRARLLGIPVARRQDDEPVDYAHPMRRAA
jgi:DNA-binding HxlR family transcriptional regulator